MSMETVEVEPIERLTQKVKELIGVLARTRTELSKATEENVRLGREVEQLKTDLASAQRADADLSSLREERERIRKRVGEMLEQLESIPV